MSGWDLACVNLGVSSSTANGWDVNNYHSGVFGSVLYPYANKAIISLGTNDFAQSRTDTQLKASLASLVAKMNVLHIRCAITTIIPRTLSSDSWVSISGQSTVASEAYRVAFNQAMASGAIDASNVAHPEAVFDLATAVETSPLSGIWQPLLTSDGIHANSFGAMVGASVPELNPGRIRSFPPIVP